MHSWNKPGPQDHSLALNYFSTYIALKYSRVVRT